MSYSNGYCKTYKAQFDKAEFEELLRDYGNGPSTPKEWAIVKMTEAQHTVDINNKVESLKAEVTRLKNLYSELRGIADEKRLTDEKIADLEEQLREAKRHIEHNGKLIQWRSRKRRRVSNPMSIYSECFNVQNDQVEPDLFDFDMEQIISENNTPLASISRLIRESIDRYPMDMSFTRILEQNYPRMLKSMTDTLTCFAFTQRGVILGIKNSRYAPDLANFQLDLCCLFCKEKQYHIRVKNKEFYFKYASPDDERHECQVSLIKQYLQERNPSAKGENKVTLLKGVESLGSDISAIIAYLLFVGKDFALRRLYGALLTLLILIDERKKVNAELNSFCEKDLKIDCMAVFEEWLDTQIYTVDYLRRTTHSGALDLVAWKNGSPLRRNGNCVVLRRYLALFKKFYRIGKHHTYLLSHLLCCNYFKYSFTSYLIYDTNCYINTCTRDTGTIT